MSTSTVSCPGILDSLLHEIAMAEAELATLQGNIVNQQVGEVGVLKEEINLLKKTPPEGLVEDDATGIQYFLAVGKVEAEVAELRKLAEITEHNLESNKNTLGSLQRMVEEQMEIVNGLELKKKHDECDDREKEEIDTEVGKLEVGIRLNKTILRELKMSLRQLIDSLSDSSPGTASVGLLLQELWANFISKGPGECIKLGDLSFEVEDEVVQQLVGAGLVVVEGEEKEMLRMVDLTCSV
eukprot:GFUD01035278.1.p1 GENE.GFUD01035278.1~~GFUD01035278.1.p1  ORF type:complete len:240 (-),score=87.21 GFUD01035278.1:43-762(-)